MFKFILIGIGIVAIMFIIEVFIFPKLKLKYLLYKEQKETKKRRKAFADKMKTLEIK